MWWGQIWPQDLCWGQKGPQDLFNMIIFLDLLLGLKFHRMTQNVIANSQAIFLGADTHKKNELTSLHKIGRISANSGPIWKIPNLARSALRRRSVWRHSDVARDPTRAMTSRARVTSLTQITLATVNQRQRGPGFVATQVAICYLLNGLVDFAHFRQADWYGQVVSTCQKSAPSDKPGSSERIYHFL